MNTGVMPQPNEVHIGGERTYNGDHLMRLQVRYGYCGLEDDVILVRAHIPQNQGRHDKLKICTMDTNEADTPRRPRSLQCPVLSPSLSFFLLRSGDGSGGGRHR